jgi:uncharacterized protein YqhQ
MASHYPLLTFQFLIPPFLDAICPTQYNPSMSNEAMQPKEARPQLTPVNYGGQAVIEGVMMRGTKALAVAVRNPEGEIVVHTEPLNGRIYGGKLAKIPFLRGLILLWDALGLGIKSLLFSAEVAIEEEEKEKQGTDNPAAVFEGPAQWGTVALSLSFAILLFFILPTFLSERIELWLDVTSTLVANLIEGIIRLIILVAYVWAIGLVPDIRRLYGYHGAEHKTINAYEAGDDLTPEKVAAYPIEHPRCGTAFLLTVVVVSILVYSLLPHMALIPRILSRLILLPIVAGLAYEFLRFTAKHQDNALIRLIIQPNLALQRLTTKEPDRDMLEVAICAFEQVLAYEHGRQPSTETVTPPLAAAGSEVTP